MRKRIEDAPLTVSIDPPEAGPSGDGAPRRRRRGPAFQGIVLAVVVATMGGLALSGLVSDRPIEQPTESTPSSTASPVMTSEESVVAAGSGWTVEAWVLDGGQCIEMRHWTGSSGTCAVALGPRGEPSVTVDLLGDGELQTVVYGAVPPGTAAVRALLDNLVRVVVPVTQPVGSAEGVALFGLSVPGIAGGNLVAVDEDWYPISQRRIVVVVQTEQGREVFDRYGNVVGVLPFGLSATHIAQWSPPGPLVNAEIIRGVTALPLQPGVGEIQRWWDGRPAAGEDDTVFRRWWLSYPVDRPLSGSAVRGPVR